jgi:dimethylargininase
MHECQRTYVEHVSVDYEAARRQHAAYCRKLEGLDVSVRTLDVNQDYPDCAFIEDVAIVLDEIAILASMGTESRSPEPVAIEKELSLFREVCSIDPPAAIEGGDVLQIGCTLLVGLSSRTNLAGAAALAQIVERHGYRVVPVPVLGCLHLKTACTALPDARLLVNSTWVDVRFLDEFEQLSIPANEPRAANTLPINEHVLLPANHVETGDCLSRLGLKIEPIDISEFAKAEGGVTCLSILYE